MRKDKKDVVDGSKMLNVKHVENICASNVKKASHKEKECKKIDND
jgi:hypothetical protein